MLKGTSALALNAKVLNYKVIKDDTGEISINWIGQVSGKVFLFG